MIETVIATGLVSAIAYFVYAVVRDVRKVNREYFDLGVRMTDVNVDYSGDNGSITLVKKEYPDTHIDDNFRYQSDYKPEPHSISNHMNDPSDAQKRAFIASES